MYKALVLVLASVMLLSSCSAAEKTENSVAENSSSVSVASSDATEPSSALIPDDEVYEMFAALSEKAFQVMCWYFSDSSEKDLDIAAESEHDLYRKVGKFSTIDEMKKATSEVFTDDFADTFFYDHAFIDPSGNDEPMYKEIDGELYRNIGIGGFGWPYDATDEYYIPYQDEEMIVITVKNFLMGDEEKWYNFLLKNNGEAWKLDTYYESNPHMEYRNTFPVQAQKEIGAAVSSWFCVDEWTDPNQLDANALINFYLYTYLSDVGEYDYEKGYEVSAKDVLEGLSVYLKDLKLETLTAVNENQYANAVYDEESDNFYFYITFDPADYIVVNSEVKENITKLEIMVIGKSGQAAYTSFLDLEINGNEVKFVGNKRGMDFTD